MTSLESRIRCLKSDHPGDIENRFVYIREILELIDTGQASINDLQTYSPSLFLNELNYNYEGFVIRHTKYGNSTNVGLYRDTTCDTSRILWMFGDSGLTQQAVIAMSELIDFLNNLENKKPHIPSKIELMLLEIMKSGAAYPLDWPVRAEQWWKDDEPKRKKAREQWQRQTGQKSNFSIIIIAIVVIVLFFFFIFKYFNYKKSNIANSIESAFVSTLQLNVRTGPGSEYDIVSQLTYGSPVICYERSQSSDGGTWVKIRAGSVDGWVNQKLLSKMNVPQRALYDNIIISFNNVAGVQVGMTIQQASQRLGRKLVPVGTSNEGCFYVEPESGNVGITFMVENGYIVRFDVTGNNVLSDQGVKIGDSEEKVKSAYPGRVETERHPYDEKGHYLKIKNGGFGMIFETDGKNVTSFRAGRLNEVSYIEGCL